jgi:hypothetical protein
MRVLFLRYAKDAAQMLLMQRAGVEQAIVGWSGVTATDLLPDQPPAELPFDKELVPLLLDQKEEDFQYLVAVLFEAYDKRSKDLEEDAKNLSRQSSMDVRLPTEKS